MKTILPLAGKFAAKKGTELVLNHLTSGRQARMIRQVEALIDEMGHDAADEDTVTRLIESMTPEIEDVLQLYFSILLHARGENTTRVMTKMTAKYWHNGKAADAFFRRFGGLLGQVQDSELERLARLVALTLTKRDGAPAMAVEMLNLENNDKTITPYGQLRFTRYLANHNEDTQLHLFPGDAEYFAVFLLLRQHGFAQERPSGLNSSSHAMALHLRQDSWPPLEEIASLTSFLVA